ncbi:zf-HC2 domain-containing protein [candidate division WOR-3 bacterium]|nr:zf-HC2 domain-containing protein [candidate division WOR-3 bacterium]
MKCSEIQKKLSAYLDNEVSQTEKGTIEAHLASCSACQHALQAFSMVNDELKLVPGMEVPPYFATRLKQRMKDLHRGAPALGRIRQFALPGFTVILTLIALILGNTMARTIYQGMTEPETAAETANVFGISAFDEYPEGSVSNIYTALITEGEK